ncbi:Ubiquitin carboxyl-terminal hydrolase [Aphelenchoides bicaudatus]|nr:Ubiquitin carboxyl-terminal hydrolase [Aphelenchoides bicaudatus]
MPKVSVKWQANKYDVDVNTDMEPLVFKSQLFELTNVLPERQKLVFKGKTIKDDTWDGINLTEGSLLMMLGSVEALLEQPKPAAEESSASHSGSKEVALKMPCGLDNLGNTCYMNSVLQSFRVIPELTNGIKNWTTSGPQKARPEMKPFMGAIYTLFSDLSSPSRESYTPFLQLKLMHNLYPQFATPQQGGGFQQQDANELFTELIREFADASECESVAFGEKGNGSSPTLY